MARTPDTYRDLLNGFSISQLAELFELDRRTVTNKLRSLESSAYRHQSPVYRLKDAAPLLVGEGNSKTSRRNAESEKDFWDAQLKRQRFEENAGDLWRTEKIVDVLAGCFKQFRESVVVFIDAMEHESGLPPEVILKTKTFGDGLLEGVRKRLLEIDTGDDDRPAGVPVDREDGYDDDLTDLGLG